MISLDQKFLANRVEAELRLSKEFFTKHHASIQDVCSPLTERQSSAFIPDISTCCLDSEWGRFIKEAMKKRCHLQRVVSPDDFSSFRKNRFDSVIVPSDNDDGNKTIVSGDCEGSSSRSLWLGCTSSFLKILAFWSSISLDSCFELLSL